MRTHKIPSCEIKSKKKKIRPFASRPGALVNCQWLELPLSRTYFYSSKAVQATEFLLYLIVKGLQHHVMYKYICTSISHFPSQNQ